MFLPSLRRQRLRRPATRDSHVDVFTGERVGEGLTYLSESYDSEGGKNPAKLWHYESRPASRSSTPQDRPAGLNARPVRKYELVTVLADN